MPFDERSYTIRRKILVFAGASFHAFDPSGRVIAFSRQKAFRLKEDIRVFADESMSRELLAVRARQVIDFSAAYDVVDSAEKRKIGAARRKGWSSILRDSWEILDERDGVVARIREESAWKALLRRFVSNLIPERFHLETPDGKRHATFRTHFNPFVYRLSVDLAPDGAIDPRMVFAAAVLLATVEGRQR